VPTPLLTESSDWFNLNLIFKMVLSSRDKINSGRKEKKMKRSTLFIVLSLALLITGSLYARPKTHSSNTATGMKMSGAIVSSSNSELVLSSNIKGKSQQETFLINPQTKTKGNLAAGNKAIVRYKDENGQKIATMVTAHSASTKATAKTK
jgi:hypothetical protein